MPSVLKKIITFRLDQQFVSNYGKIASGKADLMTGHSYFPGFTLAEWSPTECFR